MKIHPDDRVDIINAYTVELEPAKSIANRYGVTRSAIWKILRAEGIDMASSGRITVSCAACGKEMVRYRYHVRNRVNVFCSEECYYAFRAAGNGSGPYIQNRHGQRIARAKVNEIFPLDPGNVVHHEDRNTLNNILSNLKVFRNNGDHIRYHHSLLHGGRGVQVEPIWDGSKTDIFKPRTGSSIDVLSDLVASAREHDPALIDRLKELLG